MGNDGARAILDGLATNCSLTSVKLSGNKVRVEALNLSFTSALLKVGDVSVRRRCGDVL